MEDQQRNADLSLVKEDQSKVLDIEQNDIDYKDFVDGYNTSLTELKTSLKAASESADGSLLNCSEIWSANQSRNTDEHNNSILDDALIEDFSTVDDTNM